MLADADCVPPAGLFVLTVVVKGGRRGRGGVCIQWVVGEGGEVVGMNK